MKKLLLIAITGLVMISCDKRDDYFGLNNEAPNTELIVTNTFSYLTTDISGTNVYDSVKVNLDYSFTINVSDESPTMYMKFEGDGSLIHNGVAYTDSVEITSGQQTFIWNSSVVGLNNFTVSISDGFGDASTYYFNINVIDNILPIFSWVVEDVNQLDPLEKRIVVTGDDGDLYYGGGILYWQYIIDGDTTNYPGKEFYYVFPSAGTYDIGVRGFDTDQQWSNTIYINNYSIQ